MRRYLAGILVILGLAGLTVRAEDFWVKKEWGNWSEDECKKMLQDSPWTRGWTQAEGSLMQEDHYYVQDRSSIPLREAVVRQMQIDNKYDQMDETHKKAFDEKAEGYLSMTYDNVILIHVEYGSSAKNVQGLVNYWQSMREDTILVNAFLITQRGDHIPAARFISPRSGDHSFELVFPRMKSGEPVVQENDKTFSIEFPHPSATSVAQTPPRTDVAPYTKRAGQESEPNAAGSDQGRVLSEFKLDKMIWKGNRSF